MKVLSIILIIGITLVSLCFSVSADFCYQETANVSDNNNILQNLVDKLRLSSDERGDLINDLSDKTTDSDEFDKTTNYPLIIIISIVLLLMLIMVGAGYYLYKRA